jgi:E1A-binding protein p400
MSLFQHVDLFSLNLLLVELETCLTAFVAHRIKKYHAPKRLIEEIDSAPELPPRCPSGKIKIHVRLSSSQQQQNIGTSGSSAVNKGTAVVASARVGTSPLIRAPTGQGEDCILVFEAHVMILVSVVINLVLLTALYLVCCVHLCGSL